MDNGGLICAHEEASSQGEVAVLSSTSLLRDTLGEVALALFFSLLIRLASQRFSASRTLESKRPQIILSKRERERARGGSLSISGESSDRGQDKELILQLTPDSRGRVGHLWLGTVRSYCASSGEGVLVPDGMHEDVFFSKSDADFDLEASLRPGCTVTFVLRQEKETGTLRAVSLEAPSQSQLTRMSQCRVSSPTGNTLQDGNIGFSRNEEVMPECHWEGKPGACVKTSVVDDENISTSFFKGHIKFFLSDKRHGFIVCKQCQDGDVWLSHEDVPSDQLKHLTAGVPLRFRLEKTGVRPRAREAEVILLPPTEGVVKSFSDRKSYGFVSCFGVKEDVWFAASGIDGDRRLGPGMRVRVDMFKSEKGHYRAFRVSRMSNGHVCSLSD